MTVLHVFSMTDTLLSLIKGKIHFNDLKDAKFYFGCCKSHLLRDDGLVPYEAAWGNTVHRRRGINEFEISIECVDEDKRKTVTDFISFIQNADAANNVQWKTNFHSFFKNLSEDDLFLRNGAIQRVGDVRI